MTGAIGSRPSRQLIVTTSWDDGHPLDLRVADALARHGIAGTFYVPTRNSEGLDVMQPHEVRGIGAQFELGGHGLDHVVLTRLSRQDIRQQVVSNKAWLEDITGRDVRGFCYIRGEWNTMTADVVREAGFSYARCVTAFHVTPGRDPFSVPVTIQFHPQGVVRLARHLVRRGPTPQRIRLGLVAMKHSDMVRRVEAMLRVCMATGSCFHLYGHSWQIEAHGLWQALDDALSLLADLKGEARFLTNHEALVASGLIPAQ